MKLWVRHKSPFPIIRKVSYLQKNFVYNFFRVLVPFHEYEELKKIAKYHHENCGSKKPEIVSQGGGNSYEKLKGEILSEGGGCKNDTDIPTQSANANVDQVPHFEKDIINEKTPTLSKSTVPRNTLNNENIVSYLKEDHQKTGRLLLEKLSMVPKDFSYDENGIVTLFGITFPGEKQVNFSQPFASTKEYLLNFLFIEFF